MSDKPCPCCGEVKPASKLCPWCDEVHRAHATRTYPAGMYAGEQEPAGVEWQCSSCGRKWVEKDGEEGTAYMVCPLDLDAMLDTDAKPFLAVG